MKKKKYRRRCSAAASVYDENMYAALQLAAVRRSLLERRGKSVRHPPVTQRRPGAADNKSTLSGLPGRPRLIVAGSSPPRPGGQAVSS